MKVLVTANFTEQGIEKLKGLGLEVIYDPWGPENRLLMSDELAEKVLETDADALIIEIDLCHEEVFEAKPLEFIGCCRGDPLIVDLDEANARGTPVFFTPGRNADAVADLALGYMICHLRRIISIHNILLSGKYTPESPAEVMARFREMMGFELGGKVVGIVGIGAVGSAVARRVKAFGSKIMAYDPFAPESRFTELCADKVDLLELMKQADIVTIHAADVDENLGMISRELIESMKPDALFINLARASLVDDDALFEVLEKKKIGGAAIDVFASEPPHPDNRYFQLDNVIVTPHLGGATHDVIRHQTDMIVADVEAFLGGGAPKHCANPEVLEKRKKPGG